MQGLKLLRPVVLAVLAAAAVTEPAAQAQTLPDYPPDVLVISEPVLVAFEKGLRTEIALRAEFRKELAALKTKEQYEKCYGETMTSPESMKLSEPMLNPPEGVTPSQYQGLIARTGRRINAYVLRKCGADPIAFGDTWRARRLQEIEEKAADAAGPLPAP